MTGGGFKKALDELRLMWRPPPPSGAGLVERERLHRGGGRLTPGLSIVE